MAMTLYELKNAVEQLFIYCLNKNYNEKEVIVELENRNGDTIFNVLLPGEIHKIDITEKII